MERFVCTLLFNSSEVLDNIKCVLNMFNFSRKPTSLNAEKCEVLTDLRFHFELKFVQIQNSLEFWYHLTNKFKILSEKAKLVPPSFSMTFLCEARFSACTVTRTDYRSFLNAEPELLVCNYVQLNTIRHQKTLLNNAIVDFTWKRYSINIKSIVRQIFWVIEIWRPFMYDQVWHYHVYWW